MRSEAELEQLMTEMDWMARLVHDQDYLFREAIGMLRFVLNKSMPGDDFEKRLKGTREWIGLFRKQSIQ